VNRSLVIAGAGAVALAVASQGRQIATSKLVTGSDVETFRRRLAPFASSFDRWSNRYSISRSLLQAIAIKESSGNPNAIGYNGTVNPERWDYGLMQLNAVTARTAASRIPLPGFGLHQLFDPDVSIRCAAWLLDDNRRVTGRIDKESMLAQYHAGAHGAIDRPYVLAAITWENYARQGAFG